jgi:hypothetical protein
MRQKKTLFTCKKKFYFINFFYKTNVTNKQKFGLKLETITNHRTLVTKTCRKMFIQPLRLTIYLYIFYDIPILPFIILFFTIFFKFILINFL